MKKHVTKIIFFLMLSLSAFQTKAIMLSTSTCQNGTFKLTGYATLTGAYYYWSVYKDNVKISPDVLGGQLYSTFVDVDANGTGEYKLKVKYLIPTGPVSESGNSYLFVSDKSIDLYNFTSTNNTICSSDTSVNFNFTNPWNSITIKIYATTGFGGPLIGSPIQQTTQYANPSIYLSNNGANQFLTPGSYAAVTIDGYTNCSLGKNKTIYIFSNPGCRSGQIDEMNADNSFNNSKNTLYPNPTEDKITIDGLENSISKISILSSQGQLVETVNNPTSNTIDLSGKESGLYIVNIQLVDGSVIRQKVTKK